VQLAKGFFHDEITYDELYNVVRQGSFKFDYSPHDFRKAHITTLALEVSDFFLVGNLHGHKSEATTRRYFQFELTRRRKHSNGAKKLQLIAQ
jgi:integrase